MRSHIFGVYLAVMSGGRTSDGLSGGKMKRIILTFVMLTTLQSCCTSPPGVECPESGDASCSHVHRIDV